jgi:alkylated DNA nucleotide flippase Atl1
VVRSDGGIGGYAAGAKKKITLLAREGVAVINGKVNLSRYRARLTPPS